MHYPTLVVEIPTTGRGRSPGSQWRRGGFDSAVYELCTSGGFLVQSDLLEPFQNLQVTDFALLKVIVRVHAEEPPFVFNQLSILVYECRVDITCQCPVRVA